MPSAAEDSARIRNERAGQRLITAFVLSGLFFMLLPGTFLGVWNLIGISQAHAATALPQSWLQAHGQAQLFGWVGSFIIGIGFYSLTRMRSGRTFPARAGWAVWALWTCGITLRWLAGVTGWKWRMLLPSAAMLELAAFLLFYASVRHHRPQPQAQPGPKPEPKPEPWMRLIIASTIAFLVTLAINCILLVRLALTGDSPALPHVLDQQLVTLAVWGILVPTIWGFNARWLPVFAGLEKPDSRQLFATYLLSVAGIVASFLNRLPVAGALLLFAALLSIRALHVWDRSIHPPKLLNVHRSFPLFIRIAYGWLLLSSLLALPAAAFDRTGGLWGASRHALTVGFVAGMVFAIGQRVLPAFCGMRVLWSVRLMFWSLALLSGGCLLRVASEPLAYAHLWPFAWKILPVSAVMELTAVSLFAVNLGVTLCRPPAHLRRETNLVSLGGAA
nr:NnrS family protein [Paracidobacterium acidisoli]